MKIINLVCSGNLNCRINLNNLLELGNSLFLYDPESYHGGYLQLSKGKVTLFTSGKYIFIGLKSLDDIIPQYKEMLQILSRFVNLTDAEEPVIQNIVALHDFNKQINLQNILLSLQPNNIEFKPEKFPGLIYRDIDCTALIFRSGKCIFTKAKRLDQIEKTYQKIHNVIKW